MLELHFDLLRLLDNDRRGSHATRRARRHVLAHAAKTLHGLGHRGLRARGFKGRHVDALVAERRGLGLAWAGAKRCPKATVLVALKGNLCWAVAIARCSYNPATFHLGGWIPLRSRKKSGFRFAKMHGLGNDFMVADFVTQDLSPDPRRIAAWGDRRRGIGFDQFLAVCVPDQPEADFRYRIFNADGSEAEQCGNGARCFARFVTASKLTVKRNLVLQTLAGDIRTELGQDGNVAVHLPTPDACAPVRVPVAGAELELTPVSTGNPHAVIFVDDVRKADVETVGQALQRHPMFPDRVNVGFLEVVDRRFARLRVFERGVGETLACGSGACAAMAAARLAGRLDETARISLPGGKLQMAWPGPHAAVKMSGPATFVYEGRVQL